MTSHSRLLIKLPKTWRSPKSIWKKILVKSHYEIDMSNKNFFNCEPSEFALD